MICSYYALVLYTSSPVKTLSNGEVILFLLTDAYTNAWLKLFDDIEEIHTTI